MCLLITNSLSRGKEIYKSFVVRQRTKNMGKRPVHVVDLTGTDVTIDLTSDSTECVGDTKPLRRVTSKSEIPWRSKLPKHDPSKKIKVARPLSVRDNINRREFSKDGAWFLEADLLFKVAMG